MDIKLSPGFQAGPVTDETAQGAVDTLNAASRAINGGDRTNLDDFSVEWKTEGFNRDTDTQIVCAPDGKVVGYADVWDTEPPHVRQDSLAAVHPEYTGRGIGSYLLDWIIARARRNLPKAPEGARVIVKQVANSVNQAAHNLLLAKGFQDTRQSYRMRIDFDTPPEAPKMPEGITIRPIREGEERALWRAAFDSFRDHWGWVERPFEQYFDLHMYFAKNDPDHDPSLWFVAMDGEEVAGAAICLQKTFEDPDMGWVNTLGVRRPWRKRGIGLALLQHVFHEFYRRGKPRVGLGVDASSLTGATRLYEKAGMHVYQQYNTYELELRPGVDLAIKSIEA